MHITTPHKYSGKIINIFYYNELIATGTVVGTYIDTNSIREDINCILLEDGRAFSLDKFTIELKEL
jgi:hypothetical protein